MARAAFIRLRVQRRRSTSGCEGAHRRRDRGLQRAPRLPCIRTYASSKLGDRPGQVAKVALLIEGRGVSSTGESRGPPSALPASAVPGAMLQTLAACRNRHAARVWSIAPRANRSRPTRSGSWSRFSSTIHHDPQPGSPATGATCGAVHSQLRCVRSGAGGRGAL